jgi:hypothetical protein
VRRSIAIFQTTPSAMAGTVGAIFNGALQLGAAVGYAAVGSVETAVEAHSPGGFEGFAGRCASFRVLLGVVCVELVAVLVFYRSRPHVPVEHGADAGGKVVEGTPELARDGLEARESADGAKRET